MIAYRYFDLILFSKYSYLAIVISFFLSASFAYTVFDVFFTVCLYDIPLNPFKHPLLFNFFFLSLYFHLNFFSMYKNVHIYKSIFFMCIFSLFILCVVYVYIGSIPPLLDIIFIHFLYQMQREKEQILNSYKKTKTDIFYQSIQEHHFCTTKSMWCKSVPDIYIVNIIFLIWF